MSENRSSPGAVVMIVLGSLIGLIALALLAGGGGVIWINHHYCVQTMARADRTLMFLNLLLLLTVAFLPFPTKLVAQYLQQSGERDAVYAYDLTFVLMAIVYNVWWRYASAGRRLIGERVPESSVRAITRAFNPGVPMYATALLVAVFSPLASVVLTFAIAAFYLPSAALFGER